MQIPRRTLPEWKRVRRGISFRSVQCLNGGHRNAVLLFYLGKLLCRAIQLAGTQRLGERHRRGIQVGKAQILAHALQGVCCAEGFLHVLFLQGSTRPSGCVLRGRLPSRSVPSGQLPDCGSCHPWETAAQTCGSLLRCTGDGILRCNLRPSVHNILGSS